MYVFRMKFKNIIKAILDQSPSLKVAINNFFINRNAWGIFHISSHKVFNISKLKVTYITKEQGDKAAQAMEKKYSKKFSSYKCAFCDGYHVGKDRM